MADKLNRGQGLGPNTGLNQNSIKLGGLGLTAKDNSAAPTGAVTFDSTTDTFDETTWTFDEL